MTSRRFASADDCNYRDVAALWVARMLTHAGSGKAMLGRRGWADDDVAALLGLDQVDDYELPKRELLTHLRKRHRELEAQAPTLGGPLVDNTLQLAEALSIPLHEHVILQFIVLSHAVTEVRDALDLILRTRRGTAAALIAAALCLPEKLVEKTLSGRGTLARAGLVRVAKSMLREFDFDIELLPGLGSTLFSSEADFDGLFAHYFRRTCTAELELKDFPHLGQDVSTLTRLLQAVLTQRRRGINVLLYGAPGVGKTQLVRALATQLGTELYEISSVDADGDARRGNDRFRIYQLCQHLLANRPDTLILFDEVEDVLADDVAALFGLRRPNDANKAWTNQLLEQNPIPSFWLANEVSTVDPAYLRRFDYVLEIKAPPREVRTRMLRKATRELEVSAPWLERMADLDGLTPAQMAQAARVAELVHPAKGGAKADREGTMEELIRRQLRLQGHSVPAAPSKNALRTLEYSIEHVRTDHAPKEIVAGIQRTGQGRLFLYGPPGTGKTAFAQHVAKALGRPLVKKTASDLLSKWVGEAEKNIAEAFRRAQEDKAVLLIDEADSFLRGRGLAERSWEITQVNEMLVQMETFEGVLLCATNFREVTDEAALRRFDIKVRFDYLHPHQAEALIRAALRTLGKTRLGKTDGERLRDGLQRLATLTPGDIAAVLRRHQVLGAEPSAAGFLEALEGEARLKPGGDAVPMGFVH